MSERPGYHDRVDTLLAHVKDADDLCLVSCPYPIKKVHFRYVVVKVWVGESRHSIRCFKVIRRKQYYL